MVGVNAAAIPPGGEIESSVVHPVDIDTAANTQTWPDLASLNPA